MKLTPEEMDFRFHTLCKTTGELRHRIDGTFGRFYGKGLNQLFLARLASLWHLVEEEKQDVYALYLKRQRTMPFRGVANIPVCKPAFVGAVGYMTYRERMEYANDWSELTWGWRSYAYELAARIYVKQFYKSIMPSRWPDGSCEDAVFYLTRTLLGPADKPLFDLISGFSIHIF